MLHLRLVVVAIAVVIIAASNEVKLTERQNYTMAAAGSSLFSGGAVTNIDIDQTSIDLVASNLKTLQFARGTNGNYNSALAYDVNLTENFLSVRFRKDGVWLAAIGDTTSRLYMMKRIAADYGIDHVIDLGSKASAIIWTLSGEALVASLNNGSLAVLRRNTTVDTFYVSRLIDTNHSGGIAKISGKGARIYSCGAADRLLKVWWHNSTTDRWTLNQTIQYSISNSDVTSMSLSDNQKYLSVGRNNGEVLIFSRPNSGFDWGLTKRVSSAHSDAVNFLQFTSDGWHLLSAGAANDNVTSLWTKFDDWTTPTSYPIKGQSAVWDDLNKQFVIGTFGNDDGLYTVQWLLASNCSAGTVVNGSDITACTCPTGSVWFEGGCMQLNCNATVSPNIADGLNASTGNTSCNCKAGYVWDWSLLMCIRDCNQAATPNSAGTNYEFLSCNCNAGYQWDYELVGCVRYQNCTDMANSNGSNVNSNDCFCDVGYLWNPAWNSTNGGACERDCSTIKFANGAGLDDPLSCSCNPGYVWSPGWLSCNLTCENMNYSNGKLKKGKCGCESSYRWDDIIGQCVSSKDNTVAIACGIAIPLGVLGLLALAGLIWYFCHASSVPQPTLTPIPLPTTSSTPSMIASNPPTVRVVPRLPPTIPNRSVIRPMNQQQVLVYPRAGPSNIVVTPRYLR